MKVKIVKLNNRFFIEIPAEMVRELKGAEIFRLKDGYYLIANLIKHPSKEELIKKYLDLLWQVSLLPYQKRTINYIRKILGEEKVKKLYFLKNENIIRISKKGKIERIAFPDELYKKLKERTSELSNIDISRDYLIINQNELHKLFKKEPRLTKFIAVSSFEGKIYMVNKSIFNKFNRKIIDLLKKGAMHLTEISTALDIDETLTKVILRILAEKGELVEIKKGVFELV